MRQLDGISWSASRMAPGPVIVVPQLNVDWAEVDLSILTDRFRVVVVAPRGFGPSARPGAYDGTGFVDDVHEVLDALRIRRYATFGYSMNGVMAARLAVGNPHVTAVACGGFPLTADLSGMGQRARRRNVDAEREPAVWEAVLAAYDPQAAVAFWDDVAALPSAALVDVGCPIRVWWGERDAVLSSLLPPETLRSDLERRGIEYDVVPDLDHDGMLDRIDVVLPRMVAWFAGIDPPG